MRFLNDLIELSEADKELSRLPKDILTGIKSNIRKGAENLDQKWANALELVHKAYEIAGVERPQPSMAGAWEQYEENLQFAVKQLADNRGMDDDWRMSSAVFREAKNLRKVKVMIDDESYIVEATSVEDVVKSFKNQDQYDVTVNKYQYITELKFSKFGINKNTKVSLQQV